MCELVLVTEHAGALSVRWAKKCAEQEACWEEGMQPFAQSAGQRAGLET